MAKVTVTDIENRVKKCPKCGLVKSFNYFHKSSSRYGGVADYCKSCKRDLEITKHRGRSLKNLYGMTEVDYDNMLERCGHKCEICGKPHKKEKMKCLHIDHCHKTGKVRGLLCNSCNRGMGWLGDDKSRLQKAINYLNEKQPGQSPS